MSPQQARAIRNGVGAAVATAVVLFVADFLGGHSVAPPSETSPTTSPSLTPTCVPTWETVPSQDPDPLADELLGVAVVSDADAWAVGGTGDPVDPVATLVERWDGMAWSQVESPNLGSAVNVLQAVDAVDADDVWAVGRSSDGFTDRPLIEHWDGTAWSLSQPPTVASDAALFGVAAVASNDVWAVGAVGDRELGLERALILHFDGAAWTQTDVLSVAGGGRSLLSAVSASSGFDVWAVGYHHNLPLLLHFDGTSWSRVDVPGKGELAAVTASGPGEAWTVGTLLLAWDGTTWAEGGTIRRDGVLAGISGGPGDLWAVGSSGEVGSTRALVQRWDGTRWTLVPGKGVPGAEALTATSAVPGSSVWAVGYRDTARGRRTLIVSGTPCAPA
jgi:hypothetical protein